ncbi:MAG: hypothetical protein KGI75_01980 [Rhizobiaceae bacterium]|nr:hypothetical protein [Rhizobiaceae bacterium]
MKIVAWAYIAILVAVTFAHLNWQAEFGNPFNIYRAGALGVAGMLARIAYPQAPSFTCLMMIGSVFALGFAHFLANGNYGSPMDVIIAMTAALWGIAIGSVLSKLIVPGSKKPALH